MKRKIGLLVCFLLLFSLVSLAVPMISSEETVVHAQEATTRSFSPPIKNQINTNFTSFITKENGDPTYIFDFDNLHIVDENKDADGYWENLKLEGKLVRTPIGDNVISASRNFDDMPSVQDVSDWNPQWWPTATIFTHGSIGEKNEVYFPSSISFDEDQYAYQTDENYWVRGRFKSIHQIDPAYSTLTVNVQNLNSDVPMSIENDYTVRYPDAITSTDTAFDVLYHVENYGLQKEYVMKEFTQGTQDLTWGGGVPDENHYMGFKYNMDFQYGDNVEIRYRDNNGDEHVWDGSSKFKATDIRYYVNGEVQYVLPEPVATDNNGREFTGHYYVTSRDQSGSFVLNGYYNLDIYVNYRYGEFGDLYGIYNDKLENVKWPIRFDPSVDRTDITKLASVNVAGNDVPSGADVEQMNRDLKDIPVYQHEGNSDFQISDNLYSNEVSDVSIHVDLKKVNKSYRVASATLGSGSIEWSVSSQSDWENNTETLFPPSYEKTGIKDGSLQLLQGLVDNIESGEYNNYDQWSSGISRPDWDNSREEE